MKTTLLLPIAVIAAVVLAAAPAFAHNSYPTDDGKFVIVVGDQNEPMYSWKWTGLDLIIRDNATGGGVPGVERTLNATLVAPGGEELSTPLVTQHGAVGRYQFEDGHIYTQPGLYKVRLQGHINGTPVDGVYDLPGPREPMGDFTFPDEDVPTLLELQAENEALRSELAALQQRMDQMERHMDAMMSGDGMGGGMNGGDGEPTNPADAPGFGAIAALAAAGAATLLGRARQD